MAVTSEEAPSADTVPAARRRARLAGLLPSRRGKLVAGAVVIGVIGLFGLLAPMLVGDPWAVDNAGLQPPSTDNPLGTTQSGQDVLAQLAYATRGSLAVGLLAGSMTVLLAVFFGVVGAYAGGFFDDAFSLLTNVMLVIPGLPLIIVISSYVENKGIVIVAVVLAVTGWAGGARVLRSVTLSVRSRDFVNAARLGGERSWRVIAFEIFPNLLPVLAAQAIFGVLSAVLAEAGLSYLGLGVTGDFTWGSMLYYAQMGQALRMGAWWWFVPPGLLIALLGAGLSLINFALDEVINPRLRSVELEKARARRQTRLDRRKGV